MNHRGQSGNGAIIVLFILLLIVLGLAWMFGLGVLSTNLSSDSDEKSKECSDLRGSVYFLDDSYSCLVRDGEGLTAFSLYAKDEGVLGYQIVLRNDEKDVFFNLIDGLTNDKLRMLLGEFGDGVGIPKSGRLDYVYSGGYNIVEVYPITESGKVCGLSHKIELNECGESVRDLLIESNSVVGLNQEIVREYRNRDDDRRRRSSGEDPVYFNRTQEEEELEVNIVSPSDGEIFDTNESIALEYEIEGESERCYYTINGGNEVELENCENTEIEVEGEGNYTLELYVEDGNDSSMDSVNFIVDFDVWLFGDVTTDPVLPHSVEREDLPLNIEVEFESNKFPLEIVFELYDDEMLVDVTDVIVVNSTDELPVIYEIPEGLEDDSYNLFMKVMDEENNLIELELGEIIVFTEEDIICSGEGEGQLIMSLSDETNAHGETWDSRLYETEICYNDVFGEVYNGDDETVHECNGNNGVLRLSDVSNAHGEAWGNNGYGVEVCYGNLQCETREGSCLESEVELLRLSDTTNAHLEVFGLGNYDFAVCCEIQ